MEGSLRESAGGGCDLDATATNFFVIGVPQCEANSRHTAALFIEEEVVHLFVGGQFAQQQCTTAAQKLSDQH